MPLPGLKQAHAGTPGYLSTASLGPARKGHLSTASLGPARKGHLSTASLGPARKGSPDPCVGGTCAASCRDSEKLPLSCDITGTKARHRAHAAERTRKSPREGTATIRLGEASPTPPSPQPIGQE